jgi:hypothetical protein
VEHNERAGTGRCALTWPVICDLNLQAQKAGAACKQSAIGNHN